MSKAMHRILTGVLAITGIYFGLKVGFYIQEHFPFLTALLGDTPDPMTAGTRLDTSGYLPMVTAALGFIIIGGGGGVFLEKILLPTNTPKPK